MPRKTDSRDRMLRTAGQLLQRQGFAATGWRQVVAESGAPWGSQSHHFPGGKEQLAAEAIVAAGRRYGRLIGLVLDGTHPADMVVAWSAAAAGQLEATGWAEGCPVATVALEQSHASTALAQACDGAFTSWVDLVATAVEAEGLGAEEARAVATTVIAGIEGAMLLARAARDPKPLHDAGAELAAWLRWRLSRED